MMTARHRSGQSVFFHGCLLGLLIAGLVLLASPEKAVAQGCAMCRTALTGEDPLSQGIFWSVLLLMSAPFVVAGSIGGWLFYQYRRAHSSPRRTASVLPLHSHHRRKEGEP